jgi:hypothetical protein
VAGCSDNTYLFFATSSTLFGRQLGRGLTCHQLILSMWLTIFFSLLFDLVVSEHIAPSYSLFGSYASGLFGMKEINEYSKIQRSPYLSCWTRSNVILIGG